MAAEISTKTFTLRGYGDLVTEGKATVLSYDRRGRWARSLKGLGVAWAVAVATAFIPVAHFLLVPGFGLFGVFVFAKRLKTPVVATSLEGRCPDCGLDQSFDAAGAWRLPRTLSCTGCRRALRAKAD